MEPKRRKAFGIYTASSPDGFKPQNRALFNRVDEDVNVCWVRPVCRRQLLRTVFRNVFVSSTVFRECSRAVTTFYTYRNGEQKSVLHQPLERKARRSL